VSDTRRIVELMEENASLRAKVRALERYRASAQAYRQQVEVAEAEIQRVKALLREICDAAEPIVRA